jgi:hypothetical protein
VYVHTSLASAEYLDFNVCANDRKCDKDHIPDLLTDDETSTGQYTACWVVMQPTSMLQMRAA